MFIKQSTNTEPLVFLMIDSADHIAGKAGITPTVVLSKAGGAFASPAGGVGEVGYGWFMVSGHVNDTDTLGPLILHASHASADPTDMRFEIVAYDPRNTVNMGLTDFNMLSGNINSVNDTIATISGNINNKPNIDTIVASGTAAGWNSTSGGSSSVDLAGISGQLINISGDIQTINNNVNTISGNLQRTEVLVNTISGNLQRTEVTLITVSGNVNALPTGDLSTDINTIKNIIQNGTYGNNALLTAIQNIQNNTFIAATIPFILERPDSGSVQLTISIVFSDETGAAKDIDGGGNPSYTLVNDLGVDLSARLGVWTHPSTGKYTLTYTNNSSDTLEGLHWEITGTINGKLRRYPGYTQIVDTTAVDFTSTDRATLLLLQNNLIGISGAVKLIDDTVTTSASNINNLPTIQTIIGSGNVAGWNSVSTLVTVSGFTQPALTEILTSGNANGWNGLSQPIDLSGITSSLNTISGNINNVANIVIGVSGQISSNNSIISTVSGDITRINDILNTLSGNIQAGVSVSGLNQSVLSEIITSGTNAGWDKVATVVTVSGISPNVLNEILTSGNAQGWDGNKNIPEISGDPGSAPTLNQAVMLRYMEQRNKKTQEDPTMTNKLYYIHNDSDQVIASGVIYDDAISGVFVKGKLMF